MGLYWNVWIIVLAPSYESKITAELVNLGFDVGPLSGDTVNSYPKSNNSGVTLAYRICDAKGHSISKLSEKIRDILTKNKMFYFSLIISEASQYCTWYGSNIHYPTPTNKEEKPKKTTLN